MLMLVCQQTSKHHVHPSFCWYVMRAQSTMSAPPLLLPLVYVSNVQMWDEPLCKPLAQAAPVCCTNRSGLLCSSIYLYSAHTHLHVEAFRHSSGVNPQYAEQESSSPSHFMSVLFCGFGLCVSLSLGLRAMPVQQCVITYKPCHVMHAVHRSE